MFPLTINNFGKTISFGVKTFGFKIIQLNNTPEYINYLIDKKIIETSCGFDFCLALSAQGNVYGFGKNNFFQIAQPSSIPILFEPIDKIDFSFINKNIRIIKISCGFRHSICFFFWTK
jgi:alpha-tubulin suppressor-like RCC1 family protein